MIRVRNVNYPRVHKRDACSLIKRGSAVVPDARDGSQPRDASRDASTRLTSASFCLEGEGVGRRVGEVEREGEEGRGEGEGGRALETRVAESPGRKPMIRLLASLPA